MVDERSGFDNMYYTAVEMYKLLGGNDQWICVHTFKTSCNSKTGDMLTSVTEMSGIPGCFYFN